MKINPWMGFNIRAISDRPSRFRQLGQSIANTLAAVTAAMACFAIAPANAAVPSFPGAQGGGAASVGGRGGVVIKVTNLNNGGAGSLRECIDASGPRTCVFTVGGTISLTSELIIQNPFITIAGQTAPGGGIQLRGTQTPQFLLKILTNDVVIRYVRFRHGFNSGCGDECGVNLSLRGAANIIVDHIAAVWNQDDNVAVADSRNVTFSYSIAGEGVGTTTQGHHTSWGILGKEPAITINMTNIDFHHNLTMNNSNRNPLLRNRSSRVVNNLFYNLSLTGPRASGSVSADLIGNKFKRGPLGGWASEMGAFVGYPERSPAGPPSVYLLGNIGFSQSNPSGDQWVMIQEVDGESGGFTGPMPTAWRRSTPIANTTYPITAEPVANIEGTILPIVGPSRRLDCNGNWVANRDAHDTQMVNQYNNNTGISSFPAQTTGAENDYGGYPTIANGTPCTDNDNDGIADAWEIAKFGSITAKNNNSAGASGFTVLEEYISGAFGVGGNMFVIGDRVQTTSDTNVRSTPAGTLLGSQPTGSLGTVVGGPSVANGINWWNIDYDNSPDGWSGEPTLALASGGDTTPPTVSITAPANGATVSGSSVAVSANASDNVGVVGVQFKLDGVNLGAEDTISPYSITWDTTTASPGSHALTAVARDAAGNSTTSAAVNITVNNVPVAPASLTATVAAAPNNINQIDLSWTNVANETGYKIERKKGAGGTYSQIATTGADVVTYNDTTLGAGTQYFYRVRAFNGIGDSGYSPEASATTAEVTSGRQAHWKLDENTGTTAADASGNGNTGTLANGPTWVAGKIASAVNFDAVDDVVNVGSGATLDDLPAITIAAWIKPNSIGESAGRIVHKGTGTAATNGWQFVLIGTNSLSFAVDYATTGLSRTSAANAVTLGAWQHVIMTWTGSATATNLKLYVNGVETAYDATSTNGVGARDPDAASSVFIGNNSTGARTFDGPIDDVRIYNRVLTASEIQAVYRAGL